MKLQKHQNFANREDTHSTGALNWARSHLLLRNEAHHRATLSCEAPAITWHVGFWPERGGDPQDALTLERFNDRLETWIRDRVQALVNRLLKLGQPDGAREPKTFSIDKKSDWDGLEIWSAKPKAEEFHLDWHGLTVQTRVEIHPDYAAVTFIISLGEAENQQDARNAAAQAHQSQTADPYVSELRQAVTNANSTDASSASQASQLLFRDVWQRFIADVIAANDLSGDMQLIPGEIFVSLRGVVLELDERDKNFVSVLRAKKSVTPSTFEAEEAHHAISRFEQFLSRGGFKNDDREFVAARIIQNRAIFISPFGARSLHEERDDPDHDEPRRSTRFTILAKGEINSRQMGRIVSQVHSLGTLQIIALKDLPLIRAVGTAIRLEDDILDQSSKELTKTIRERKPVPEALELKLCELESRLDVLANRPTGGLAYRVFRSAYYASEFERRLENLDAKEITRWQRPETFFAKRLFSVFNYIQNVGARMERLRRRISSSLETIQTRTLVDLTRGVHKIQRSGEIVSAILLVIGIATFFGEVLGPAYQAGVFPTELPYWPDRCREAMSAGSDECKSLSRIVGYGTGLVIGIVFLPIVRLGWRWLGNGRRVA
jgi:hypothetical protein